MRPAPARPRGAAPLAVLFSFAVAFAPACVHAQEADRLDVTAWGGWGIERFHSLGADTLGLSSSNSPDGGVALDFRVIDLPVGKTGPKPALHLSGALATSTRILGPAVEGMEVARFRVLDFSAGAALELPLDAFLKGNSGVGVRLGWEGGDLLTRTDDQGFLVHSKFRFDFVRTSGALAGSSIGFGKGRDDTFGYDANLSRWDAHVSLQGRLIGMTPPAPPAPAGKPVARAPAAPRPVQRVLWAYADVVVDTDGGPLADGLRARAGLGFDVNAFFTAAFTPKH